MNTNRCEQCDELFWCDDSEQGLCPTCKEEPSKRANAERALEQWADYIRRLHAQKKES